MKRNEILIKDANLHFSDMPADTYIALRGIAARRGKIYGPHQKATGIYAESTFSLEPRSDLEGRLDFSEITALLLVHNETRALAAQFAKGGPEQVFVRELLAITDDDWPSEVIEGMANFVHFFGYVAGIRERVVAEKGRPTGSMVAEKNLKYWWDHFAERIVDDGFLLGCCVCRELIEVVDDLANRNIQYEETGVRGKSQRKGAELAAMLYLNVLGFDREN